MSTVTAKLGFVYIQTYHVHVFHVYAPMKNVVLAVLCIIQCMTMKFIHYLIHYQLDAHGL